MKWKLVPEEPTKEMVEAAIDTASTMVGDWYKAMIARAPQPEYDRMAQEGAHTEQYWKGVDGAIAFHLIERHADGWHQVGEMMEAWLEANRVPIGHDK